MANAGAQSHLPIAKNVVRKAETRLGERLGRRESLGSVPEQGSQTSPSGASTVMGLPTIKPLVKLMVGSSVESYLLRSTL